MVICFTCTATLPPPLLLPPPVLHIVVVGREVVLLDDVCNLVKHTHTRTHTHAYTHAHSERERHAVKEGDKYNLLAIFWGKQMNCVCTYTFVSCACVLRCRTARLFQPHNQNSRTPPTGKQTSNRTTSDVTQRVPLESQRSPAPKGTPHPTPTPPPPTFCLCVHTYQVSVARLCVRCFKSGMIPSAVDQHT